MAQVMRIGEWLIGLAIAAVLFAFGVFLARPADPQRGLKRMQAQIAEVRRLPFKRDLQINEQSHAEFEKHTKGKLRQLSTPQNEQVMRTLGVLASDETLGVDTLEQQTEAPGTSVQYDPDSGRLVVVKAPPNPQQSAEAIDDMYAREIYRALIDQHFDLKTYLARDGSLNSDQLLARKIAIESEANYGAVLRQIKQGTGRIPDHLHVDEAFHRMFDTQAFIDLPNDPRLNRAGSQRKPRREPGSLPTYLSHLTMSMQREGVSFARAVRERGLNELEKLYTTAPPDSTEQILHPEKWFARERPATIEWPAFEQDAAFADWELMEQNVLGELLLRVVFRAHHFSSAMGSPAAGWNGDRFAVFKRRHSGETLLLLYTAWDTESHAAAFAESYRVLSDVKHADVPKPSRIVAEGRRVVIVEGGEESSLDTFMKFAQSAKESQETPAVEK